MADDIMTWSWGVPDGYCASAPSSDTPLSFFFYFSFNTLFTNLPGIINRYSNYVSIVVILRSGLRFGGYHSLGVLLFLALYDICDDVKAATTYGIIAVANR